MHVMGHGEPAKLASTLHAALLESKTPLSGGASANTPTESNIDLDTAAIDKALGCQGKVNGGVYQMNIPRADKIRDEGMEVPDFDGVGNRNQFPAHRRRKCAITGDFVLTATEVNPVIKALRGSGIEVTALHNHMLNDEPRLFFMHFWGNDQTERLLSGLKLALSRVNT
jgi:hypothetical protein